MLGDGWRRLVALLAALTAGARGAWAGPPAVSAAAAALRHPAPVLAQHPSGKRQPEVIIAGGGIGGLCTALVLNKIGYDVQVFEKTSSYRPFGGPIQIASNAAESIRRIDEDVYNKILAAATVIGDRTNGLKDGLSDEWFATFDLDSPARKRGQVSSVVIDRPILQDILLERVGSCVTKGAEVVGSEQVGERVRVHLSTGRTVEGDMLVGSDGINSRVRDLFDPSRRNIASRTPDPRGLVCRRASDRPTLSSRVPAAGLPTWSGYTCVAGMAYCVPSDIAEVGYKVWVRGAPSAVATRPAARAAAPVREGACAALGGIA